jgi:hypothetical protein
MLDQLQVAQAGVAVAGDDQVVVQDDPERGGGLLDVLGHRDVGFGRGRVARGVVVHQDQYGGAELERALDNLARVDRGVVDWVGALTTR